MKKCIFPGQELSLVFLTEYGLYIYIYIYIYIYTHTFAWNFSNHNILCIFFLVFYTVLILSQFLYLWHDFIWVGMIDIIVFV